MKSFTLVLCFKTLDFVHKFEQHINHKKELVRGRQEGKGNGTRHKEVTYETASRKGEPVIKKYTIPQPSF